MPHIGSVPESTFTRNDYPVDPLIGQRVLVTSDQDYPRIATVTDIGLSYYYSEECAGIIRATVRYADRHPLDTSTLSRPTIADILLDDITPLDAPATLPTTPVRHSHTLTTIARGAAAIVATFAALIVGGAS